MADKIAEYSVWDLLRKISEGHDDQLWGRWMSVEVRNRGLSEHHGETLSAQTRVWLVYYLFGKRSIAVVVKVTMAKMRKMKSPKSMYMVGL